MTTQQIAQALETLEQVKALVLEGVNDPNNITYLPIFFIATKSGFSGKYVMHRGFWFSYEAAERHLERCRHLYPTTAFVHCDSADRTNEGVQKLYRLLGVAK